MKSLVITPVMNEEKYLSQMINSMLNQSIIPDLWIIVNDGSTDKSKEIIESFLPEHSFIKLVNKNDVECIKSGGEKVVRAFNYGLSHTDYNDFTIVSKIDADLILPLNYFDCIISNLISNNKIGIIGGHCIVKNKDIFINEPYRSDQVIGPLKTYRVDCFNQIGGLPITLNWDGIDNILAKYYGWVVLTLDLPVKHLKPTSTDINNNTKYYFKAGEEDYRSGYDISLCFLRAVNNAKAKRNFHLLVIIPVITVMGFLKAFLIKKERFLNKEQRKFARKLKYIDIFKK